MFEETQNKQKKEAGVDPCFKKKLCSTFFPHLCEGEVEHVEAEAVGKVVKGERGRQEREYPASLRLVFEDRKLRPVVRPELLPAGTNIINFFATPGTGPIKILHHKCIWCKLV